MIKKESRITIITTRLKNLEKTKKFGDKLTGDNSLPRVHFEQTNVARGG